MVEKRYKRDLDSLSCLKHRELCTAVHSTVKNINLVHNAVTKNEMRAWEDFIDPLFKFCLHLKLCQIMIVAIMCVFKCFVREVN